jgi:hypothetical protein
MQIYQVDRAAAAAAACAADNVVRQSAWMIPSSFASHGTICILPSEEPETLHSEQDNASNSLSTALNTLHMLCCPCCCNTILPHALLSLCPPESRRSNAAVGCATFNSAVQAVEAAMASHKWLPPSSNQSTPPPASEGLSATWAGCSNSSCPLSGNTAAVPLKLEIPLYIRLLEFGHEQAKDCDNAAAAVEAFVQGLVAAGCSSRACSSSDYLAARPVHGCRALVA